MEKLIIILKQMVEQGRTVEAERLAEEIKGRLKMMIDSTDIDEDLVRLAKMQKIVGDLEQQLKA
ncbi:hypothetical protein HX004_11970 [Myroides sp. 1354]|uniref:hypothetical protein n=1 Tax=unclassified Myroides TaxID=2642485 RepID=UPI0025777189|nr:MULTISPECIES: hypothetical protein [unclassified Myroides]MDM1045487.1 hypothetical protein [Myroides sp. R163-1]MDM1056489.1 hypothetical protein [Myroides sp. 1354]MDM1069641.1 hypothetical protein [Myroides sp. 1372]